MGETGLILMGGAMISKSLILLSVDGQSCVPSLLFGLRPNCRPTPPPQTPGHSQASLAQSLVGTLLLSPGSWLACTRFCLCPPNCREGTQPHPSTENWIKDLLSMALSIRARPRFSHQEASHKPLILIHQRADRMKTTITENQTDHMDPSLV